MHFSFSSLLAGRHFDTHFVDEDTKTQSKTELNLLILTNQQRITNYLSAGYHVDSVDTMRNMTDMAMSHLTGEEHVLINPHGAQHHVRST